MTQDRQHYTLTMARLLADQGHWPEAVEIYRHLLRAQPGRNDLVLEMAEAERRLQAPSGQTAADLVPLFEEWTDLIFRAQRMQRLRRLKQRL